MEPSIVVPAVRRRLGSWGEKIKKWIWASCISFFLAPVAFFSCIFFFSGCELNFICLNWFARFLKLVSNLHPLQVWEKSFLKGNLLAQVAMFGTHFWDSLEGNIAGKPLSKTTHQTYQAQMHLGCLYGKVWCCHFANETVPCFWNSYTSMWNTRELPLNSFAARKAMARNVETSVPLRVFHNGPLRCVRLFLLLLHPPFLFGGEGCSKSSKMLKQKQNAKTTHVTFLSFFAFAKWQVLRAKNRQWEAKIWSTKKRLATIQRAHRNSWSKGST